MNTSTSQPYTMSEVLEVPDPTQIFLHMSEALPYKNVTNSLQKFLTLVIPKSWKYTVLVEAHDKLRHQGNTNTYCLLKCQYYWKGIKRTLGNTSPTVPYATKK